MSVQTTYANNLTEYFEGQITQQRDKANIQSKIVAEAAGIAYGRQTFLADTAGQQVRLPHSRKATLVFGGANPDLVASNVVNGNVVLNGATTAINYTFAVSHLASITAIAALIAAVPGVLSAVVDPADATNRTILVTAAPDNDVYLSSFAVTLGATQPTSTVANTDNGIEYGPSITELDQPDSSGVTKYLGSNDGGPDAAGIGQSVYTAIRSDAALVPGQAVYVRFIEESGADKKRGMLTNAPGSNPVKAILSTNLTVSKGCAPGQLAEIRINK